MRTSEWKRASAAASCESACGRNLRATNCPSFKSSARYTSPMPPCPASATMRYRSAMICPGVKRPPPIGSELVSSAAPPPEGVRAARVGVGWDGGRAVGRAGAIVSCATLKSSESMVASGLKPPAAPAAGDSRGSPQDEQNRPLGETCAPQTEQNIQPEFYHRASAHRDPPPQQLFR
jgi:hypothetical protein